MLSVFNDIASSMNTKQYSIIVMSKDLPILSCVVFGHSNIVVKDCKIITKCFIDESNIASMLNNRFTIFNRFGVTEYLRSIGLATKLDLLMLTRGVSLSDCLWVKQLTEDNISWSDVNPYNTEYKMSANWMFDKGNPILEKILPNYSLNGRFPKCWVTENGNHYIIKSGTSMAYNAGMEPLSELLFQQIADGIGYKNHVVYEPYFVDYSGTDYDYHQPGLLKDTIGDNSKRLSTKCKAFTDENHSLVSAQDLGIMSYRECLSYAITYSSNPSHLISMLLCDCIGFNEDRHFGNIGFIYDPNDMSITGVAPMFDNGTSMLCYWEDRIDLDVYVNLLRVKNESTSNDLYKWLYSVHPKVKYDLRKLLESTDCLFKCDLVISNRLELLDSVIRDNIKMLLSST